MRNSGGDLHRRCGIAENFLKQRMPSVETARLRLRMFSPDDLDDFAALIADAEVMRYVGSGLPNSREEAERTLRSIITHWDIHGFGRWAIVDKHSGAFIGYGGLRSMMGTPEVVYHFTPARWGRGLATEAAGASLRYGFEEHGFDRILAIAKPENLKSIRVMEKLGLHFEKRTSYYEMSVVEYSINRDEFRRLDSLYVLHD
jgi:RimJ/RimL family protein N-acetyltransferase